jgi:hypothetical protein
VHDAERILGDAWVQVMVELRDSAAAEAHAAFVRCGTSREQLAAAQIAGDPRRIAAAHTDLEQALSAAKDAVSAHAHACQALTSELDLLASKGGETTADATAKQHPEPSTPYPFGALSTASRSARRLLPWARRVAMLRLARLRSS